MLQYICHDERGLISDAKCKINTYAKLYILVFRKFPLQRLRQKFFEILNHVMVPMVSRGTN